MINVNVTHANDYLVSKLTIGLSGQFFFSELVEKKSVSVNNGMISTNYRSLFHWWTVIFSPQDGGHMTFVDSAFPGF